mmetsp:Transcript_59500/g.128710  ORF Transcript_59500/g.128710 Transcript_59500/m.128710 type:complete len:205 (-) Transcript_59500:875-1489(-)
MGAVFGPDYVPRHHIDAAYHPILRPVIEADEIATSHTDEPATIHLFHSERRFEGETFLEVLVHSDFPGRVPRGVSTRVTPDKLMRRAERLVSERLCCVDHIFAITADDEEAAIGVVGNVLRENFCGAHILDTKRYSLAVASRAAVVYKFQIGSLDLVAFREDYLSRVHRGYGLLAAQLDHHCPLVIADCGRVAALQHCNGPDAL